MAAESFSSIYVLIKWVDEECWDVVSAANAGYCASDFGWLVHEHRRWKSKEIKFEDQEYQAVILQIGKVYVIFYLCRRLNSNYFLKLKI